MKVILIDDEKAMHLIMKRMLAKMSDIEVVGCFLNAKEAYAYLTTHEVDMVFVDISMPRENGLEFAERVRASGRATKIVFITSHKEYALSAFDVYAFDYIVKPVVQERLFKTVERARAEIVPDIDRMVTSSESLIDPLTNRELDIALAIIDGLSNMEIAKRFGLTEGTVKGHINRLYGKLGIKRRVQTVARMKELRMLP
ncbi:response regulator transcription factor [Paenibacillus qinlingensis]|uniref:response regulator transcription factor n=1 Tax=Paenibacillus qinlingensis TaxID=1837343 RepID=UPI0015662621|nr:response regulator transcription factor [Paenibacillus qinlingensis]NQX61691.1 response regulator transcription factor [Paenibacillus qinlingensis]